MRTGGAGRGWGLAAPPTLRAPGGGISSAYHTAPPQESTADTPAAAAVAAPVARTGAMLGFLKKPVSYAADLGVAIARGNWATASTAQDWTFRAFLDALGATANFVPRHVSESTARRATFWPSRR